MPDITTTDQVHYNGLVDAQTADLERYLDLNANLARVELDTAPFAVPHIDADARARQVRNEVIRGLDEAIATAVGAIAVLSASIGPGAAVHVIGSFA